jgi:(p)ppGpp synthase/HD superfamily hydrolase
MKTTAEVLALATRAHSYQYRRDGVTPYINHPKAVADSLACESDQVIAAALLHDVLEDTKLTEQDLRELDIDDAVIEAVKLLTKGDDQPYEEYLQKILTNEIALKVKLADIKNNLSDSPTAKQVAKYSKALQILATQ